MSIWMDAPLLAATSAPATTTAATRAVSALPLEVYGWAIAEALLLLAAAVGVFVVTYGRSRMAWAPQRVDRARASLPLWLVAACMTWSFLIVPGVVSAFRTDATRPASDGLQILIYTGACAFGLIVAASLHFVLRRCALVPMLGLVPLRAKVMPGRMLVAAMLAVPLTHLAAAISLLAWQLLRLEHEPAHAMLQLMQRNEATPWVLWVTIFNAALLAPVFEEVLFRGHIQTALTAALPWSRWPAIVITSLLFASIHDPWAAPAIFTLSLAIGVAYEWSGSLWVAIGVHVAFNAISTVGFLAGQ